MSGGVSESISWERASSMRRGRVGCREDIAVVFAVDLELNSLI